MTNSKLLPGPAAAAIAAIAIATVVATIAFLTANAPAGREGRIANCLVGLAVMVAIVIVAVAAAADNSSRKTGPGC